MRGKEEIMRIGNYYVGVDCNGDLYEHEAEENDVTAIDRDFSNWLTDMTDCDPSYDDVFGSVISFA